MKHFLQEDIFQCLPETPTSGWFVGAMAALNISEGPGWPDRFGNALKKWNRAYPQKTVKTLSLFSGGGGLDIGFHEAGFNIVESLEIESAFAKTLELNASGDGHLAGTNIICGDIHDYHPSLENIDFIIGGPPCQTFSAAGARAAGVNGTDDERGNLFLQYARLLERLQPKGFLFENVYRIVGAQSGQAWEQVQAAFERLGYRLFWRILDAADYGVPQFRERLIIVGLREGEFKFPLPSHGPDSQDGRGYYTAGQAVSDIEKTAESSGISGRHGHLLNAIPPGLNYSFYTERMGHPTPIFAWRSKFSDYLYKADPETPVRTIKAQGGQYTGPFSWCNRPFALAELKRLQTFPDDYVIHGNRQTVIHQLGNSVPPQFARTLALSILDQVFQRNIPFQMDYMNADHTLGFRARKAALTDIYANKARRAIAKLGSHQSQEIPPQSGSEYFRVEPNLSVHTHVSENGADYHVTYHINAGHLYIQISEANTTPQAVKYRIDIDGRGTGINSFKHNVSLSSSSAKPHSVLAAWKFFELIVQRHFHKDDLIQLFGYYQYKNSFTCGMSVIDSSLSESSLWKIIKGVTEGFYVGSIIEINTLCSEYRLTPTQVMACLSRLKEIGYEIRNNNTNQQIKEGMILIPYNFPTLNERSLQRLTRL